ncbi:MAG: DUF3290 family protein [Bifidobacteriaceae bacterium]|nr:DUF3290 family protein [Bifidobacteriaceae bacterium]
MKFYSYQYLLNQANLSQGIQIAMTIVMLIMLCASIFKFLRSHGEVRYRELSYILVVGIVIMVLIQVNAYLESNNQETRNNQSVQLVESIAAKLNVKAEKVYANIPQSTFDGTIVKYGSKYYRVNFDSSGSGDFVLESINLYQPSIELVEAQ